MLLESSQGILKTQNFIVENDERIHLIVLYINMNIYYSYRIGMYRCICLNYPSAYYVCKNISLLSHSVAKYKHSTSIERDEYHIANCYMIFIDIIVVWTRSHSTQHIWTWIRIHNERKNKFDDTLFPFSWLLIYPFSFSRCFHFLPVFECKLTNPL